MAPYVLPQISTRDVERLPAECNACTAAGSAPGTIPATQHTLIEEAIRLSSHSKHTGTNVQCSSSVDQSQCADTNAQSVIVALMMH
jgi:hypothetical protein